MVSDWLLVDGGIVGQPNEPPKARGTAARGGTAGVQHQRYDYNILQHVTTTTMNINRS